MSTIVNVFREGGWGMWPVLFLGTIALVLSCVHALRPRAEVVPLINGLKVATLIAGALGFGTGIHTTIKYLHPIPAPERALLALDGFGESLNNVLLALGLVLMVSILLGVGGYRAKRGNIMAPSGTTP